MENQKIKCSSNKHKENDAINYCQECKLYLCNKCEKVHSEFYENHNQYKLDANLSELFTGFCKAENHFEKLEFYCKNHNQLCCGLCITKIKGKKYGQHAECEVCFIENIKEEKKNKLKDNINMLEELSKTFDESINKLKKIIEEITESKEQLKTKIQKVFTKIRNAINEKEDNLLLQIDKEFNDLFVKEEIIKEYEKLPNKIKISLEKGKIIDKEWVEDENKLNSLINDCLNIENNISNINMVNENMKRFNSINLQIKFYPQEEEELNKFIKKIKDFGNIRCIDTFKFKNCPIDISEERKYSLSGENNNILTKNGTDCNWMGTICENKLDKYDEYKWKIKVLNSNNKNIMVGVAPIDFDINSSTFSNCGWYFSCCNSMFYSGPPHNYPIIEKKKEKGGKKEKQEKKPLKEEVSNNNINEKSDYEIILILNISKKTLNFIVNNEEKKQSYSDIPLDKPLVPAVFLYNTNDSIEIINC